MKKMMAITLLLLAVSAHAQLKNAPGLDIQEHDELEVIGMTDSVLVDKDLIRIRHSGPDGCTAKITATAELTQHRNYFEYNNNKRSTPGILVKIAPTLKKCGQFRMMGYYTSTASISKLIKSAVETLPLELRKIRVRLQLPEVLPYDASQYPPEK